jgi:hypothetical protein
MVEHIRAQPGKRFKLKIKVLLPAEATNVASKSRIAVKCMTAVFAHARYEALPGKRKDCELKGTHRLGKIRKLETLFASDLAVNANKRWAERSFLLNHAVTPSSCPSYSLLSHSLSIIPHGSILSTMFYKYTFLNQAHLFPGLIHLAATHRTIEETVTLARVLQGLIRESKPPQEHPDVLTKPMNARADVRAFLSQRSKVLHMSGLPHDTTQSELESWFTRSGSRRVAFWTLRAPD